MGKENLLPLVPAANKNDPIDAACPIHKVEISGFTYCMQYVKPDISTLCIGQAASMGSFLLAAGTKGKRFSLPNSRIMVHQPSAGFQGQATDIEIHANEVLSLKKRLNEIYSKHTGKTVDEIKSALERDNFMTADVAKSFGLIDEVVEKRS